MPSRRAASRRVAAALARARARARSARRRRARAAARRAAGARLGRGAARRSARSRARAARGPRASASARLDRVLELAHVAGPGVAQRAARARRRSSRTAGESPLRACFARKCCARSGTSSHALAQRRHVDAHHVEPVEEVGAEARRSSTIAARSRLRRGDRRGCRRAPARRRRPAAPRCCWSARSSFACTRERQLADLVEEERAAVRERGTGRARRRRR